LKKGGGKLIGSERKRLKGTNGTAGMEDKESQGHMAKIAHASNREIETRGTGERGVMFLGLGKLGPPRIQNEKGSGMHDN